MERAAILARLPANVRGSRLLFADDIMSRFFVEASGGEEAFHEVHPSVEAAITAFMRFTNAALDEWIYRAQQERAARFFDLGEGPLPWLRQAPEATAAEQRTEETST